MALPSIDEAALRLAIQPADAVAAVREAFRADGEGRTAVPAVINLPVPGTHGEFHVKTAWVDGVPLVAVKVASGFYDNPARGLPTGSGLMALFDAATGMPIGLIFDNGFLTDLRTGAAGAVAADCLARQDSRVVGVIGSGVQARRQVTCLREVRPVTRLFAWSIDSPGTDAYCAEMRATLGIDARPAASAEDVCREADILITATPSRTPIVRAAWLRPGMHVTAVGSDTPGKQELDADCLARADRVVVDRLSQCAAFGEVSHAIAAGLMRASDVSAQLGEIVAGHREGRTAEDQITICDLTGVGFQDTAIAALAWSRLHGR
ncbi:MAG: ornithine cyclodeaminase family protein [Acidobacteria bacterium]|nr:ornithine cyclodeaminase family protein [Acidobacteriota bacterium]